VKTTLEHLVKQQAEHLRVADKQQVAAFSFRASLVDPLAAAAAL